MNRAPIYHESNPNTRMISCPSGKWQFQRRGQLTGSRELDPWVGVNRPTEYLVALRQLDLFVPER